MKIKCMRFEMVDVIVQISRVMCIYYVHENVSKPADGLLLIDV